MPTVDMAMMILEGWHSHSRLTSSAYRQMGEIAVACVNELGENLPDNAMTNGMIIAWLKAQPNVWANGSDWKMPENQIYLGLPE